MTTATAFRRGYVPAVGLLENRQAKLPSSHSGGLSLPSPAGRPSLYHSISARFAQASNVKKAHKP